MASFLADLAASFLEVGDIPATVITADAMKASIVGKKAAKDFLDSLVDSLQLITEATAAINDPSWASRRETLLGEMSKTFDSFGLGLTEGEKLSRLEGTYVHTMLEKFNERLFGQMFGGRSTDDFPFIQFWTEHDDSVCEDCRPLDGAIFDKSDEDLPFILPELHYRCRCWIEELTRQQAADNIEHLQRSARKFILNVSEDFRYDKRTEQEVAL